MDVDQVASKKDIKKNALFLVVVKVFIMRNLRHFLYPRSEKKFDSKMPWASVSESSMQITCRILRFIRCTNMISRDSLWTWPGLDRRSELGKRTDRFEST